MTSKAHGLWAANDEMEATASAILSVKLRAFGSVIGDVYELAVESPTLKATRHDETHIRGAAVFLKRTLTDLRSVWILTKAGHTTSAGAVAAALVEHAWAVELLSSDPSQEERLRLSDDGDLPLSPKQLVTEIVHADVSRERIDEAQAAARRRNMYAAYKWLCKIKHPTLRASHHAVGATEAADGAFVVMAAPDMRANDLPVKTILLTIVLGRVLQATKTFSSALELDEADEAVKGFKNRLAAAETTLLGLVDNESQLPFVLTRREGEKL